jgi:hypothetical protein
MLIAQRLLDRAEQLLHEGVWSVKRAVHGAVLATDALELLGGKTPTMAAEALSLKHQFELLAECQFSGIKYHLDVKSRLDEVERDSEAVARWFRKKEQKATAWNIQMEIINRLIRILREYNQFDEERICLAKARRLHNLLYARDGLLHWIAAPFLHYSTWLLASFKNFLLSIMLWTGALWLLYPDGQDKKDTLDPLGHAIGTFFGVDPEPGYLAISFVGIIGGLFHLGIFISMIYEAINRR